MADITRVKCNVCANATDSICSVKKCKIAINKKRLCKSFDFDKDKADDILVKKAIAETIPSDLRPDWIYDKKQRREVRRAAIAEYNRQVVAAEGVKAEKVNLDFTKPDCLANIRSSASNES